MTDAAARLRRVRELFDAAMEQPAVERLTWLAAQPDLAPDMAAELRALLGAAESTDPRLATTARPRRPRRGPGRRPVGQRLGPYDVVRLVGRGGMGAVYEAERADDQLRASGSPSSWCRRGTTRPRSLGALPARAADPGPPGAPATSRPLLDGGMTPGRARRSS